MTSIPRDVPTEDSDAESFHSAISSVTRQSSKCWNAQATPPVSTRHRRQCRARMDESRPKVGTEDTKQQGKINSRPSSTRSRQSSVSVSRRTSSFARKNRSRTDSVTLHRQSCQLFSSLDGVLVSGREVPLRPGTTSLRSATRHTSVDAVPPSSSMCSDSMAQHTVQQLCETIDAKLRLAQAQRRPSEPAYPPTYSAPSSSSYAIPSGFQSATTLDISPRTSMSQDTCTRASSNLECKKSDTSKYTVHHHHHGHPRPRPQLETVISWTSNATRRKEYAKIDRAHSGVRGFLRRLVPRCVCKTARKGFFTGYCDGNSVRRFRMNVCGENGAESEDDETEAEEKQDPVARDAVAEPKTVAVAVAVDEREQQERKEGHESPRSRWTCLQ